MVEAISRNSLKVRFFHLTGRGSVMLAADLAGAYQTQPEAVAEAVRRYPARFPDDFAFRLDQAEAEAIARQGGPDIDPAELPLAFSHAGAVALSGVLRTAVSAELSVIIYRAYVKA